MMKIIKIIIVLFIILNIFYHCDYENGSDTMDLRRVKNPDLIQNAGLSACFVSRIIQELEIMENIKGVLPDSFNVNLAPFLAAFVVLRIAQDIPEYQDLDMVDWLMTNYNFDLTAEWLELIETVSENFARDHAIFEKIKTAIKTDVSAMGVNISQEEFEPRIYDWPSSPAQESQGAGRVELPKIDRISTFSLREERFPEVISFKSPDCREITAAFNAGEEKVFALTTLPDGRLIAAGDLGVIKIWDLNNSRVQLINFEYPEEIVMEYLSVLGTGEIVSVDSNGDMYIWDINKLEVEIMPAVKDSGEQIIAVLPDLRLITVDSRNISERFSIWDAVKSKVINIPMPSLKGIHSVIELDDGRFAAARGGYALCIWDLETKQYKLLSPSGMDKLFVTMGMMHGARGLIKLPGDRIISAAENEIRIWDIKKQKLMTIRSQLLGNVNSMAFLSGNRLAVISMSGNEIKIIDLNGMR